MKRHKEKGSVLIESSLALLLVMLTVIGICDFAQILFRHQSIVERVRGAVRWGATNVYDEYTLQNLVLYGSETAPTPEVASFDLTRSMVRVQRLDSGTTEDRVVITVSDYPVPIVSPLLAGTVRGLPIMAAMNIEEP